MSMDRTAAIQHFGCKKYYNDTILSAFNKAPTAAKNGLAMKDIEWINRHPNVPAIDAVPMLFAMSYNNPEGICA